MKQKIFISLLLISYSFIFAQKQTWHWYFGTAGIDFSSGEAIKDTKSAMFAFEGCAAISDEITGELRFYTNGIKVWNAQHQIMLNGDSLKGGYALINGNTPSSSTTQSSLIVPMPDNSEIYYLFTIDAIENGSTGMSYSIVDMSLENGLGGLSLTNQFLIGKTAEKITAVQHYNKKDMWVMTHGLENEFYAYLVTSNGIPDTPVISKIGTSGSTNFKYSGYMKFSPNGKHIALIAGDFNSSNSFAELFCFNDQTGEVSNPLFLTTDYLYGLSFSPNSTKLYLAAGIKLYQYDLSVTDILGSKVNIIDTTEPSVLTYSLQLAPDGKIYGPRVDNKLHIIENPDLQGMQCGFTPGGFNLTGKTLTLGMPNFIESYFNTDTLYSENTVISFDYIEGCKGEEILFYPTENIYQNMYWDFGDGSSLDTIQVNELSHIYEEEGSYIVRLIAETTSACFNKADTVVQEIHISSCKEDTVFIPNAMSINNDGINDIFYIKGSKRISIYNRHGKLIFYSEKGEYWDGTFQGKKVNSGVYLYLVEMQNNQGNLFKRIGNLEVIN